MMHRRGKARGKLLAIFQDWHLAPAYCAGAYHSLQRLRGSCDLVVVTSRQHCIRQPTLAWVQEHFPDVFREVHFGNHWALEGKSKAKSEICRLDHMLNKPL